MLSRLLVPASALVLTSCAGQFDHLGQPPEITEIGVPAAQEELRVISMPMPTNTAIRTTPSAIWTGGRRSFFDDQRADDVGDILTVVIDMEEEARLRNSTSRQRAAAEGLELNNLFGLEQSAGQLLPEAFTPGSAVDLGSDSLSSGSGAIDRNEEIFLRIAAVITQRLPNGNFVIAGRQEVRVNFELRELRMAGVIRPEDISPDNTIDYFKIAEARISYGGRGQITDVQQPRIGQQIYDIIMPF